MDSSPHLRRASQQSVPGTGHDLPSGPGGPGRGGYNNRGRGGFNNAYSGHMSYQPNNNFRPQNNHRGGFQGGRGHNGPYQGSPSMAPRTPMMNPGTPTMTPMHMAPGMQNVPQFYQNYSVNNPFPSSNHAVRGKPSRGSLRGGKNGKKHKDPKPHVKSLVVSRDPASDNYMGYQRFDAVPPHMHPTHMPMVPVYSFPDLSPESGNFENILTQKNQAYGQVPVVADPSITYNAQQNYQNYPFQYQYPPASPRPPFQTPGYGGHGMQPTYSNQGQMQGPVPPSMSRQSSQMSTTDRPGSSIGQTPQTPAAALHHASARAPSVSNTAEKAFIPPPKKNNAIVIKNAAGEVVDFSKKPAAQPAVATPTAAAATPSVPTPPSRTGSAAGAPHVRSDSQTVKPEQNSDDKKKAMQEAVARRIAEEKEQENEKLRKQKEAEEQKAQMEAEAAAAAEREAAAKKEEAERLEREAQEAKEAEEKAKAKAAEEEKAKAAEEAEKARVAEEEKAKAAAAPAPEPEAAVNEDDEFERMAAEMEREEAEREAEEARKEEAYLKKKAAEKEAARKKEEEEAASYEANMREMERKAEEEELAREAKRKEGGNSDEESKKIFAALKSGDAGTSGGGSPEATPVESGAATPSELSMPPPAKSTGARRSKPGELTLDTKKSTEPPEPSATLKALNSARLLEDPSKISYPSGIVSPNPALNANAPADRKFKYNKEFLLQFQNVFKEKPSLDWDQKIREALGHDDSARPQTARTPSGMGTRSASNRGPAVNTFGVMGSFGGGRALPPGTTSEQRFAASNAALRGGPVAANPFALGRPGSMGPPMARTPSNNPLGNLPGSPRVGGGASRGGSRAESKRNKQSAKQEESQNKTMPLTAGLQVGPLEVSSTGWKPLSLGQNTQSSSSVGPDGYMEADVVQRKVKAALNKMTPDNFEKISDGILQIAAQSKGESDGRTLRQVIQLVFEKATDEAHWAPMYAKFCLKMLSNMSNEVKDEGIKDKNGNVVAGGNLFRKYLLNRCQEEFEKGWKINLPGRKEGESEEAVMLSDEYYIAAAAKRRGLGLVRFIGELFKLGMLTERIMHECVKKLLDYEGTPEEAEVESLSSLLKTIGKQLDSPESKGSSRMDIYFDRITQTMNIPDLPSRLRFMLLDIIDLRNAGWQSKDQDKGPKTIDQIHAEAEAARAQEEMQRLASQAAGRGGGRLPMGRGDARSFSGYGQVPPPDNSNRVGAEDLRRLGGRNSRAPAPTGSLGPSLLGARTNSGRRGLGPSLRPDDSAGTSRTGTPPASKDAKKDESSTNAFRYVNEIFNARN